MNEIKIFENKDFGKIQIIEENGKFEFEATESAKILGYLNPHKAIGDHCRWVTKREVPHPQSKDKYIFKNFISEGDLYRLITHSKLEGAERFESWIFDEVLPSIRKNGGYIQDQENLSDDELMAKALLVAQNRIAEKNKIIEEQKPKVELADTFIKGNGTVLVSELAVILQQKGRRDIGELKLFNYLRNNGYLSKQRGREWNKPTNKGMELGLFKIKQTEVIHRNGYIEVSITPLVTAKGQNYFINKFIIKGEVL